MADLCQYHVKKSGFLLLLRTEMSDHNKSSSSDESFVKLAIPYNEFDVWVVDINERELELLGRAYEIEHLGESSFSSPVFPVNGKIHGPNIRYMIPLVCQRAGKPSSRAINVWFLVDTGSPFTCLTVKSLDAIFGAGNATRDDDEFYAIAIQVAAVAPPLQNAGISDANKKRSTVANTRTAPPPPPPPPPPVFLKSHSGMPTIKVNDLQQVKLNHLASGDRQRPSSDDKPASRKMAPSLTEVLKELNTVQLKKLPKSPGGTPLVRSLSAASPSASNKQRVVLNPVNREHFQSSCDQGSFLADALRNKFKNVRLSESFNEQENDCSTDEEDLWNK